MNENRYSIRGLRKFSGHIINSVEGRGEEGCPKRSVIYVYDENYNLIAYSDQYLCGCCIKPDTINPFYGRED